MVKNINMTRYDNILYDEGFSMFTNRGNGDIKVCNRQDYSTMGVMFCVYKKKGYRDVTIGLGSDTSRHPIVLSIEGIRAVLFVDTCRDGFIESETKNILNTILDNMNENGFMNLLKKEEGKDE